MKYQQGTTLDASHYITWIYLVWFSRSSRCDSITLSNWSCTYITSPSKLPTKTTLSIKGLSMQIKDQWNSSWNLKLVLESFRRSRLQLWNEEKSSWWWSAEKPFLWTCAWVCEHGCLSKCIQEYVRACVCVVEWKRWSLTWTVDYWEKEREIDCKEDVDGRVRFCLLALRRQKWR